MNQKMVRVYNDKPRLINGPHLDGQTFRFLPGENQVPETYVQACFDHKISNGKPGTGTKLFVKGGPLRLLTVEAEAEPTPVVGSTPALGKVPLPESLEGFSTDEALEHINKAVEGDDQLLINWGQADDREVVQQAIMGKLKVLGYGS